MKIFLAVTLFLVFLPRLFAQPGKGGSYTAFIPKGYTVLDSAYGDLNRDTLKDLILILRNPQEKENPDATRPLLLLAGTGNEQYKLIARNDSVVLCAGCGGVFGDPYSGITIKNGYFSIEHYGGSSWRWTRIITFKYDPAISQFRLHRDAGTSYHTSNPNKQEQVVTNKQDFGKLLFNKYSYAKEM